MKTSTIPATPTVPNQPYTNSHGLLRGLHHLHFARSIACEFRGSKRLMLMACRHCGRGRFDHFFAQFVDGFCRSHQRDAVGPAQRFDFLFDIRFVIRKLVCYVYQLIGDRYPDRAHHCHGDNDDQ